MIVFPLAPTLSSPGSCIPLLLSSENIVDPIEPRESSSSSGNNPKSIVLSPFASIVEPLFPPSPGSFVGSVPGASVITDEVIIPSVIPSPFVSACIPLSSESTPSSTALPVEDIGSVAGGINSMM